MHAPQPDSGTEQIKMRKSTVIVCQPSAPLRQDQAPARRFTERVGKAKSEVPQVSSSVVRIITPARVHKFIVSKLFIVIILVLLLLLLQRTSETKVGLNAARRARHPNSIDIATPDSSNNGDDQAGAPSAAAGITDQASRAIRARGCSSLGDGGDAWPEQHGQRGVSSGNTEQLDKEQEELLNSLGEHYNLSGATRQDAGGKEQWQQTGNDKKLAGLPHLPRPSNLTVLIISWYPPILKLSWELDEGPNDNSAQSPITASRRYDFYQGSSGASHGSAGNPGSALGDGDGDGDTVGDSSTSEPHDKSNRSNEANHSDNHQAQERFDLELALATSASKHQLNDDENEDEVAFQRHLQEIRIRRKLLEKSLTCFQVTYNNVNSR